jgi:spore maturation protein CgeB
MLKVLFAAFKYDYGKPQRGLSVEYTNFYDCLRQMPNVQADFFAVDENTRTFGREQMNQKLIQRVRETNPDLLFCFLLGEELKKETIAYITTKTRTKTFNWFADDHWRIPVFSRYWAPLFTMVSTTDAQAKVVYKSYGITNVIKTQWGANPYLYQPVSGLVDQLISHAEVAFVGQKTGRRGGYIKRLKKAGLPVAAFGSGWPEGRVRQRQMLEIFSYSKINLNFSETYYSGFKAWPKLIAKLFMDREMGKLKFIGGHFADNFRAMKGTQKKCIKGRVFEVPACGGFLLTAKSDDDIGEYYVPDKEIAVFDGVGELIDKIKYYLAHEPERLVIAKAGFQRTIKEHTYDIRFREIFKFLNF